MPPRIQSFIGPLLRRDASGSTWLPGLLAATPHGAARLGELLATPGWLVTPLAVATASGELGAFTYTTTPPRELLAWYFEHPEQLSWPAGADLRPATQQLRRALLDDEPPGARAKAQERARELIRVRTPLSLEWWRFEETARLDCVLVTDRLVVTIHARDAGPVAPATDWYPRRSRLVRDLEAAHLISTGRQWATILISEFPHAEGEDEHAARALRDGAPHLDAASRAELRAAFLGNLTWAEAAAAVAPPARATAG